MQACLSGEKYSEFPWHELQLIIIAENTIIFLTVFNEEGKFILPKSQNYSIVIGPLLRIYPIRKVERESMLL
jgi:hypothetical protein